MKLFEVFSAPYETKQVGNTVEFTSENGKTYIIKFLDHKTLDKKSAVEIVFGYNGTNPRLPGHTFFITNMGDQGDPFKVMGTVYTVVADYLKNRLGDVTVVKFAADADETSKQGVYDRLSQKFLKILGPEWSLEAELGDECKEYVFTKKEIGNYSKAYLDLVARYLPKE